MQGVGTLKVIWILVALLIITMPAQANMFAMLGTSLERMIGQMAYDDLVAEYGGVLELRPEAAAYLEEMFIRIVEANPRRYVEFSLTPLNSREINAFALPGGFVFVTRGLLELVEAPEELAGVLGHEVAHIAHKHGMNALIRQVGLVTLARLLLRSAEGDNQEMLETLAGLSINLLKSGWSREAEYEADASGARIAAAADYDPAGLIGFLTKMQELQGDRQRDLVSTWFATHPPTEERIMKLRPIVKDYHEERFFLPSGELPRRWVQGVPLSNLKACA